MLKEINSLIYYNPLLKLKYSLYYKNGKAVLEKVLTDKKRFNKEKKTLKKECLSNLDIFFGSCDFGFPVTDKNALDEVELIVLEHKGSFYKISAEDDFEDKNVFTDIKRYLEAWFNETADFICLSYHSFDGGGPEYTFETEIKGVFTWYCERIYAKENREEICGAGYDVVYTLYPLRKGKSSAKVSGSSPIAPVGTETINIEVDENLSIRRIV